MSLLSVALVALTLVAPQPADAPALEREARQIERMLVAPCCWMQPVAQHQSQASDEVKRQIRTLLAAGKTRQQVLDAFVAQYGPRILVEPPLRGFGAALYAGLALVFVLSGAALLLWVRRSTRRGVPAPAAVSGGTPPDAAVYAERLDEELRDMD